MNLRMIALAALGGLFVSVLPSVASAHQWRSNEHIEQRCDRDGDVCAAFRCDRDGDDCVQISEWRRQYARYDRRGYGYDGYSQYNRSNDRDDGYYNDGRREQWRGRRRDRDDDDQDDDWGDGD